MAQVHELSHGRKGGATAPPNFKVLYRIFCSRNIV